VCGVRVSGRSIETITRRIQQAYDITDLVSESVRLVRAGKDFKGLCPFHEEKTPSFYVVPSKQIFKCFGCGVGGDVFKFVQLRDRVDFREARRLLAEKAGISLEDASPNRMPDEPDRAGLLRVNEWAYRWFRMQMSSAGGQISREYAARRGLTDASIESFGIGFAPDSWDALYRAASASRVPARLLLAAGLVKQRPDGGCYDAFRNRLMFPIRDAANRVIAFGGRALGDDPAKYLNSSQSLLFDKSRCLYGLDLAKSAISSSGFAVVVEGYLDCVMAHQFGYAQTVATLGTALGESHAGVLRRYAEKVVLLYDSDEAGQRAADRGLPIFLSNRLDVQLARLPEGKDPCDFLLAQGGEAFSRVLNSATDALESKWQQVRARYRGTGRLGDSRRAVEDFLTVVATAIEAGRIDPIHQGFLVNQVAQLLGLEGDAVRRQLKTLLRRPTGQPARPVGDLRKAPALPRADASAAATQWLLEVLLNEPGYFASVEPYFDPELLRDESLQRIGRRVVEAATTIGEFELSELLAQVESVEDAQRIVALHWAGQQRGHFAATVEGAVARLQQERLRREAEVLRAGLQPSLEVTPETAAATRALLESAKRDQRFASRRHVRMISMKSVRE
jgi:DNA primase